MDPIGEANKLGDSQKNTKYSYKPLHDPCYISFTTNQASS